MIVCSYLSRISEKILNCCRFGFCVFSTHTHRNIVNTITIWLTKYLKNRQLTVNKCDKYFGYTNMCLLTNVKMCVRMCMLSRDSPHRARIYSNFWWRCWCNQSRVFWIFCQFFFQKNNFFKTKVEIFKTKNSKYFSPIPYRNWDWTHCSHDCIAFPFSATELM